MKVKASYSLPTESDGYVNTWASEKAEPVKAFFSDTMQDWRDKDGRAVKVALWEKEEPEEIKLAQSSKPR